MRLSTAVAEVRLGAHVHGVLTTIHPQRGPEPVPVVYAVSEGHLGIPIDRVKPKSATRLTREDNLDADPRAALLIEHWDADDWSRLWWVRANLEFVPEPSPSLTDGLADRLARSVPQYADRPFYRVLAFRLIAVTGWAAE